MVAPPPRLVPLALITLAACGPATSPPPPPTAVEISFAPSEPAPAPPPPASIAPAAPPFEVLAAPSAVGCAISATGKPLSVAARVPLCTGVGVGCFGTIPDSAAQANVTLTFPEGDARRAGVHVELDDGKVSIRGIARTTELPLYPRLLFTMGLTTAAGDFVLPLSRVVVVEGAAHGVATVAVEPGTSVVVAGGAVRTQRRCNELKLDGGGFSSEEAKRFVAGKITPRSLVLPEGTETPLSTAPGQPPVASLRPPSGEGDADVDVLERRGQHARIYWERDGFAVFGWVPAGALKQNRSSIGGVMGGVTGSIACGGPQKTATCGEDVALIVELAGRRVEVGRIHKGGTVVVGGRRDGFVAVDPLYTLVALQPDASWLVREADFDRACRP